MDPYLYLTSEILASPPSRVTQSLKAAFFARQVVHCSTLGHTILFIRRRRRPAVVVVVSLFTTPSLSGIYWTHQTTRTTFITNGQNFSAEFCSALWPSLYIYIHRHASNRGVIVNAMLHRTKERLRMFSRGILGLAGTRGQAETTTMHGSKTGMLLCRASSRAFLPYIVNSSFESSL